MSASVIIKHDLPPQFIALQHETLDQAMALCERAHAIAIPSAKLDLEGNIKAVDAARILYNTIDHLSKQLEEQRKEPGRQLRKVIVSIDEAFNAAIKPLEDQRAKLGSLLLKQQTEQRDQIAKREREAAAEKARVDAERRAAAEAAERKRKEAEAAAAAAAEAAEAARVAAQSKPADVDAPPDDAAVEAARAAELARAAQDEAAKAHAAAVDLSFTPQREVFVPQASKAAVKANYEYGLQVDDLSKVPPTIAGVPLFALDEAAALKLLKAGVEIPGLTLLKTEKAASNRRSAGAYGI